MPFEQLLFLDCVYWKIIDTIIGPVRVFQIEKFTNAPDFNDLSV